MGAEISALAQLLCPSGIRKSAHASKILNVSRTEATCEAQSRSDIPPFHREALRARIWRDPFGQTEEIYLGEPDMRWQNERRSDNVEDRRGVSAGQIAIGGGIGTILIV